MNFIVLFLSIAIFIKVFSYGLYELKMKNKLGASAVILVSLFSLIAPNVIMLFRK